MTVCDFDGLRTKNNPQLQVDFINVGFGDSILIRLIADNGNCFTILVDTGESSSEYFEGQPQRIKSKDYLKQENIAEIDLLVLTHCHRDHSAAALEIIQSLSIKQVWLDFAIPKAFRSITLTTQPPTEKVEHFNSFNKLLTEIEKLRIPVKEITQNTIKVIGALKINALIPERTVLRKLCKDIERIYTTGNVAEQYQTVLAVDAYLNATCLVLQLEYQGYRLLLPADITPDFWSQSQLDLSANIIKAPHHGDWRAFSPELLRKTNPDHVVISVDNKARYGFPSPELEDYIKGNYPQTKLFYTDVMPGVQRKNPQFIRFQIDSNGIAVSY